MVTKRLLSMFLAALLLSAVSCVPPLVRSARARVTAPDVTVSDLARQVDGNSAFALDLYQALREEEGNLFYSPYSLSLALAMTYAGTLGETAQQMVDTLHFVFPQDRLHPVLNRLDMELSSRGKDAKGRDDQGLRLSIVNAIWGQKGEQFLPEFLDTIAENYGAGLRTLDFAGAPEESRNTINEWVEKNTEGRIKNLIPPDYSLRDIVMCLTNAIHFKAAWMYPFIDYRTHPAPFYLLDGSEVSVPMMNAEFIEGANLVRYGEGDDYQAIELPYYGGECSMLVMLPREGRFQDFQDSFDAGRVEQIINDLTGLSEDGMKLNMPKFTFESEYKLREVLAGMGMPAAFYGSDFAGMVPGGGLWIDQVFHKAYVSVDEVGTEAAATSAVAMMKGMWPNELTINRPFIFFIRDIKTGTVLFIGRVMNPRE
jgi:serpin B